MEYLRKIDGYVWMLHNDRSIHQVMNGCEAKKLMSGFVVDTSFRANGVQLRTGSLTHGYYDVVVQGSDRCAFKKSI